MNCEEFELRLNDVLDERRLPAADEALQAHVTGCAMCRDLLAGVTTALAGAAQLRCPQPSLELGPRVLAELHEKRSAGQLRTVRTWGYALLAIAATLLLAAWLMQNPPAVGPANPAAQPALADAQPGDAKQPGAGASATQPLAAAGPSMNELVRRTGQRYEQMLHEANQSLIAIAMLLPGVSDPRPGSGPAEDAPKGTSAPAAAENAAVDSAAPVADTGAIASATSTANSSNWVQEIGDGLRPVTATTAGAFGFLLEILPEIDGPPRS